MSILSERLLPYRAFLKAEQQRLENEIRLLKQQGRQDEADLHRVRLNICGVFETVAGVDEKLSADWEDFCRRYEPRFDTLTAPWRARLSSAVLHSDTQTRFVEEAKLSAAKQIQKVFDSLKE